MTPEIWMTFAVLAGAVYLFVTEKLPVDVVAMLVLATVMVLGLVTPREALSGFSSEATITVAAGVTGGGVGSVRIQPTLMKSAWPPRRSWFRSRISR